MLSFVRLFTLFCLRRRVELRLEGARVGLTFHSIYADVDRHFTSARSELRLEGARVGLMFRSIYAVFTTTGAKY